MNRTERNEMLAILRSFTPHSIVLGDPQKLAEKAHQIWCAFNEKAQEKSLSESELQDLARMDLEDPKKAFLLHLARAGFTFKERRRVQISDRRKNQRDYPRTNLAKMQGNMRRNEAPGRRYTDCL